MYYCKACGSQYTAENAVICVKCGVKKGEGSNYCHSCGTEVPDSSAAVCLNCGVSLTANTAPAMGIGGEGKSKMTAGLFALLLGSVGVHNFYLGYTSKAVVQLVVTVLSWILSPFTCFISLIAWVGIEVWAVVEGVFILTGKITHDKHGNLLQ
ncbi:MAG: NINE protein [Oscillospiraceae bacterium]|nr:NINE protein [Oscillospiraceae bacterium]